MSQRFVRAAAAAALLASCVARQPAGAEQRFLWDQPTAWEHPESVLATDEDLFPREQYGGDLLSLSWYLLVRMDNGYVAVVNLFRWRYSFVDTWGILVLVTDGDGSVFRFEDRIPGDTVAESAGGTRLEFRDGSWEWSRQGSRLRLSLPGFRCDLWIENILPPWMPAAGLACLDPGCRFHVRYAVPAPWAEVSGSMEVFGSTVSARGQGCWDTSLSVLPLRALTAPVYAIRAFSPAGVPPKERWLVDMVVSHVSPRLGGGTLPMLLEK